MSANLVEPESFYEEINRLGNMSDAELIEAFGFFLHERRGLETFKPRQVDECFEACHLAPPSWTRVHLNRHSKGKSPKFIKAKDGYKLSRSTRDTVREVIGTDTPSAQTSKLLTDLSAKLTDAAERAFLEEAVSCFRVGANRATIVMVWILTMDHMYRHVLAKKHTVFMSALQSQSDKKLKVLQINQPDDFTEMKEAKFIEIMRSAKIISNDVRKILDEKLGTRNSAGHPSGIKISKRKVEEFVEDLIDNVILKYPVA